MCEVLRVSESGLEEVFGHEREHLEASMVKKPPSSNQMGLDIELACV